MPAPLVDKALSSLNLMFELTALTLRITNIFMLLSSFKLFAASRKHEKFFARFGYGNTDLDRYDIISRNGS